MRDDIFQEALMIGDMEPTGICARGIYAMRHMTAGGTIPAPIRKAIKTAWDADPLPYARAAKMRPTWFDRSVEVSKFELLSVIEIGKVKDKYARALLAEQHQNTSMSYTDVHAAVQSVNKPKARTKKVKHCPNCGAEQP